MISQAGSGGHRVLTLAWERGCPVYRELVWRGGKGAEFTRRSSAQCLLHLVMEMPDAGFERAEGQGVDRARGEAALAERGGAIIFAGKNAFVEQGPAAFPMVHFLGRAWRLGD